MLTTGNNILKGVQIVGLLLLFAFSACSQTNSKNKQTMKYNQLTKEEEWVILHKGTASAENIISKVLHIPAMPRLSDCSVRWTKTRL